ncbi:serine/threonine-protein kinase [Streptomyces agglomeratus]|uniref:serine/threonine-protein kinase n=1 Tax=Streptomyces agglomeratus TaxID=285458 RepID=UPI000854F183|nr:serine/threonine-protein kinase [Streptomyces agglomeratus]OEJ52480.1 serine/threonine protein kinase [Streptomyces agglomeratus]
MGEIFAGRYELIDPIGRGGVGAVWRSWDHRRRRYVAAKVLQQSDAHTLLRFVREQALRIDHPHVLAPASWAADDDKVLFTMDLVSGGSLAHLIGDYGPLPPRFVCTLLDQLLSGLTAVHAEGVVHRDIKPANILLEATGTGRPHLRLSDFGISMRKGEPRLTETNYVVGTPGYFAPEQLMGAEPDFAADLFAVGLVALYLVQGQKPDSRALVEHFATHGTPSAPQGIPEPLWQVIAGMLQPDPQARFRTATGARKALTAAVEMLPEAGPGEEPVEVFDQIGPLPPGFGPEGPAPRGPRSHKPDHHGLDHHGPDHHGPDQHSQSSEPGPAAGGGHTEGHTDGRQPHAVPQPSRMSETGSFHLAPPPQQSPHHPPRQPEQPPPPHPAQPYTPPTAAPAPAPAPFPAHLPSPHTAGPRNPSQVPQAAAQYEQALTRPYTAQRPEVPTPQAPTVPRGAHTPVQAPRKRPGPPPKVTVPVLLLALACFAVGIWALTQS